MYFLKQILLVITLCHSSIYIIISSTLVYNLNHNLHFPFKSSFKFQLNQGSSIYLLQFLWLSGLILSRLDDYNVITTEFLL